MLHVTIPPGFAVTTHSVLSESSIARSSAGLLVANLGYVGDDARMVQTACAQVHAELARTGGALPPITVVTTTGPLSSLLMPAPPATATIPGPIVWTTYEDGLAPLLATPAGRQYLREQLAQFADYPQWLVIEAESGQSAHVLSAEGWSPQVMESSPDQPYLLEVKRPDGSWVVALVPARSAPRETRAASAETALLRAPRLCRALLATASSGDPALLYQVLHQHAHPLLFLVRPHDQSAYTTSWPGHPGPALPVFADRESVSRYARESGIDKQAYGVAQMSPRALLQWASQVGLALALGAFNASDVRYWYMDKDRVASLHTAMR